MCYFYSLTSLRVNVALSVCSCRRRGSLQGHFDWSHRLPGGRYSARAATPRLRFKPGCHHQRAECPRCRGSGHVRLGWHGVGPARWCCHGNAVTASPKMMCGQELPEWTWGAFGGRRGAKICCEEESTLSPHPRLRYFIPSQPAVITQRHGAVPLSTLHFQQAPFSEKLCHSAYVNTNNTWIARSTGFGVVSYSVKTVWKCFRLGRKLWMKILSANYQFFSLQ